MTALIVLESLAVLLLAVLVAGLLRSHAEILRRLHELGAGLGDEASPAGRPVPVRMRTTSAPVAGTTPDGAAVSIGIGRPGERTLLLFLTSGCSRCHRFWDALAGGAHRQLDGTRTVVVARDSDEESPARLADLAPSDLTVVQSSRSWDDYRVPGSPFAVVVGPGGHVTGEGTAATWDQLMSLVMDAEADAGTGEARADRALQAAGIHPGHPSLYPPRGR